MKLNKSIFTAVSLCAITLGSGQANAAGYSSDLYSASGLGNAYAGSVTGVHDASDLFYNPSLSIGFDKPQLVISASYIDVDIDADNTSATNVFGSISGNDGNNGGKDAIVPAFYLSIPINNELGFGLSVNTPFGLATKYNQGWAGRYRALESSIQTININPSLSYKVSDKLSIGAGVAAQHYKATLTKAVFTGATDAFAKAKADDWGYGYNLGLNYEINDDLEFGLGYRSKIDHNLKGNSGAFAAGVPNSNIAANTTTPESVTVGLNYKLSDDLEVAYDTTWMRWSRVNSFTAKAATDTRLNDNINFQFRDSLIYSLGANYTLNSKWLLRSGLAYEKDAVTDAYREPRLPTGDRIWTTLGLNYKLANDFSIDTSYLHQFHKTETVNLTQTNGTFDSNLSYRSKVTVNTYSLGIKKEF